MIAAFKTKVRYLHTRRKFKRLLARWHKETSFRGLRSWDHPAYVAIIQMGDTALPFIFEELRRRPDNLYWALNRITGENPIPENHEMKIELIRQDWLTWGRAHGYLPKEGL